MAVRKIKTSWWVDFRLGPVRHRKRSPENSKAGAQAYEAMLRQKLARGEPIELTKDELRRDLTFGQFAWQWFDEYVVANNKYLEQRMKKYTLRGSLVPFFGKLPLRFITSHHVEQYKAHVLKTEGISRKTVNNRLAIFRKCIVTAYEWLQLPGTAPKVVLLKCPPPPTDYLSADECELLLSKVDGVIREMILTALRTGMRHSELTGLQWPSINWENRIIIVRHSRCSRTGLLQSPKSNRERHVPMDADVYEVLFKRRKTTGYVFLDKGRPFESHRMIREIREVRYRAGLRQMGWHTLRHTFASHLAIKGAPLHVVQALLGHSSIGTTMRYAHVAPSALRTAIDMLNPKSAVHTDFGQPAGNQWIRTIQPKIKNP
jgi:integrase